MTLLRTAKDVYRNVSLRIFGNTIGLKSNLLYALYGALVRTKFIMPKRFRQPSNSEAATIARAIGQNGMAKLEPIMDAAFQQSLKRRIDCLFARKDKVIASLKDSGLLRLKGSLIELPELEAILIHPRVSQVIQSYFGSYFKIFSCDVYRTVPDDTEAAFVKFSSLKWHFDNCPASLLKIMIYLTDTTKETGAVSLVPKDISTRLKAEGFWDRSRPESYENEINRHAVYLEGKAGTVLFFSTHYCIHRATLPTTGHRDVAVFLVQPSLAPQPSFSEALRNKYSYSFGYCVNPFSDKPLRYGEE